MRSVALISALAGRSARAGADKATAVSFTAPAWSDAAGQILACTLPQKDGARLHAGFLLDRSGVPEADSLNRPAQKQGPQDMAHRSFPVARRAVLRCGRTAFDLTVEKHEEWRNIELTFGPERTIWK